MTMTGFNSRPSHGPSRWDASERKHSYNAFRGSGIRFPVPWDSGSHPISRSNNWRARSPLMLFRRAHEAHRDACLCFFAARDGRPLELSKRLFLGKHAGGLAHAQRGLTTNDRKPVAIREVMAAATESIS